MLKLVLSEDDSKISIMSLVCTYVPGLHLKILGRDVSSKARNMFVEVQNMQTPAVPIQSDSQNAGVEETTEWDFTVFRVDPEVYTSGNIEDIMPPSVLSNAGMGRTGEYNSLRELYKGNTSKVDLGHNKSANLPMAYGGPFYYGGIVIKGKISPSRMLASDFDTTHSRLHSFNWTRSVTGRQLEAGGCIKVVDNIDFAASDMKDDDVNDMDEDLIPDNDEKDANGQPTDDLFIWVMDAPTLRISNFINPNSPITRKRQNFVEMANYAGIQVSKVIPWFWRVSAHIFTTDQGTSFTQLNDVTGDNKLGEGSTLLTPYLGANNDVVVSPFTVTSTTPTTVTQNQGDVPGVILGTNLNAGGSCIVAYLIYTDPNEETTTKTVVPFTSSTATTRYLFPDVSTDGTKLTGKYRVPTTAQAKIPDGSKYTLKVFIGDKVSTIENAVTITPSP